MGVPAALHVPLPACAAECSIEQLGSSAGSMAWGGWCCPHCQRLSCGLAMTDEHCCHSPGGHKGGALYASPGMRFRLLAVAPHTARLRPWGSTGAGQGSTIESQHSRSGVQFFRKIPIGAFGLSGRIPHSGLDVRPILPFEI
jgi:hypothetical protein